MDVYKSFGQNVVNTQYTTTGPMDQPQTV